jgi:hypothetical protein
MIKKIFLLLMFSNTISTMGQTNSFKEVVERLYFGIYFTDIDSESILHKYQKIATSYNVQNDIGSLTQAIHMSGDSLSTQKIYTFNFINSPLDSSDSIHGYIKINTTFSLNKTRITNIDWVFKFKEKKEGQNFFEKLKQLFSSVSGRREYNEVANEGMIAQFSDKDGKNDHIKGVTLFFLKPQNSETYEIRMLPYNEFTE